MPIIPFRKRASSTRAETKNAQEVSNTTKVSSHNVRAVAQTMPFCFSEPYLTSNVTAESVRAHHDAVLE